RNHRQAPWRALRRHHRGQPGIRRARRHAGGGSAASFVRDARAVGRRDPAGGPRRAAINGNMGVPTPRKAAAMSLDPNVQDRIRKVLEANHVVLFMKGSPQAPQCGFSAKAVGALSDTGADYAHVDVLSDPEIREGIKAYGQWPTIPQLYIGGELVGGSDIK